MNFKTLKQAIYNEMLSCSFSSNDAEVNRINKIIASCLLYDTITKLIDKDASYENSYKTTISSYRGHYKEIAESLEGRYNTYNSMKRYIRRNNIQSFMEMNIIQIAYIIELYQNKKAIQEFSTVSFSSAMYSVPKITLEQEIRLKKIHYRIIVPIVKHYLNNNHINIKAVSVEDGYNTNPGKEILLGINGISSSRILVDIENDIFNVSKYISKVSINEDGLVDLIIK